MTTTLKSMEETIAALHAAKLDCKIMVGGAVLTPEYAEKIGADWYAKDAKRSADIAKEFFGCDSCKNREGENHEKYGFQPDDGIAGSDERK